MIKPLGDVDIFLHTWDIDNDAHRFAGKKKIVGSKYVMEQDFVDSELSCPYQSKETYITENIRPVSFAIENHRNFLLSGKKVSRSSEMYYSIFKANQYKNDHEKMNNFKYDIVVRSRMDILYDEPIPDKELKDVLESGCLYVGTNYDREVYPHSQLFPDTFCFSRSDRMDFYSEAHFKEQKKLGVAETLITTHLKASALNVKWTKIKMKISTTYNFENFMAVRNAN
jgi:hypothetical protein